MYRKPIIIYRYLYTMHPGILIALLLLYLCYPFAYIPLFCTKHLKVRYRYHETQFLNS